MLGRAPSPEQNAIVAQEQKLHGDILQININETYENLVYKTLIGLRYARDFCSNAKYVMKVDDDIFVNLPLVTTLLHQLELHDPRNKIVGACYPNITVLRRDYTLSELKLNKIFSQRFRSWITKCEDYPFKYYPDYAQGHSYIVTSRLAWDLLARAKFIPVLPVEDAFITGVLRTMSRMNLSLNCQTTFSHANKPRPNPESFPINSLSFAAKDGEMRKLWTFFLDY